MTEAEWLACTEPKSMLALLRDRANERQLRLFAVSCCRRVWPLIADERARTAVEVAEQYADGLATEEEREEAQSAAARVRQLGGIAAKWAAASVARTGAMMVVDAAGQTAACPPGQDYAPVRWQAESQQQCKLLRDIFGNLFRPTAINPAWLTWNDGTVSKIAQAIYDERAFDRMPILADALEESGCTNTDILNHCRRPGEHVRGCWVVDLILGKD